MIRCAHPRESIQPGGELRLGWQGQEFISERRIQLLEAIEATGSISRAAKQAEQAQKAKQDSDGDNDASRKDEVESKEPAHAISSSGSTLGSLINVKA